MKEVKTVFLQYFHDPVRVCDLCFSEQATDDRLANLVVTFLVEIDFIDSPTGGDDEYFFLVFI